MSERLIMFMGDECEHCHKMEPIVQQLEKETGVKVERLETWHDAKNASLLKEVDTIDCGGVPFFYNEKTKKGICGETTLEKLKEWAGVA